MSASEIRLGQRPFSDPKRFPKGLSRSGDFSISQAHLLQSYGLTLQQLQDGSLQPENDAERHFLKVIDGTYMPETALEKAWIKYLQITKPKAFFTLCGSTSNKPDPIDSIGLY